MAARCTTTTLSYVPTLIPRARIEQQRRHHGSKMRYAESKARWKKVKCFTLSRLGAVHNTVCDKHSDVVALYPLFLDILYFAIKISVVS